MKDFEVGIDKIDLDRIDANTTAAGDQAFAFIGNADFHNIVGELRFFWKGDKTYIEADLTGDGTADLSIKLAGNLAFTATDFVL